MSAVLILRDQVFEVKAGMTIRSALVKVGIEPNSVLATRDGELVTDDELLIEDDKIKLIAVISGGKSQRV